MKTSVPRRAAALAAALAFVLASLASLGTAPPAQADHCQPEELVVRMVPGQDPNWQSPIADDQDPRCVIAAQLGCPNQADPQGCIAGIRGSRCYIFRPTPEWILVYADCYMKEKGLDIVNVGRE